MCLPSIDAIGNDDDHVRSDEITPKNKNQFKNQIQINRKEIVQWSDFGWFYELALIRFGYFVFLKPSLVHVDDRVDLKIDKLN